MSGSSCCCPSGEYEPQLAQRANLKSSKQRKCTDCCCFLIFFLSVGVMMLIQTAAAKLGDPNKLLHGADYTGTICGVGDMAAKPYAHYPRLGDDLVSQRHKFASAPWNIHLYGLCVEACPAQDEDVHDYICEQGSASCLWAHNPLLNSWHGSNDVPNSWHTAVRTSSLMGRCMPLAIKQTQDVELCAFPDCETAGKECFKLVYPNEHYWLPANEAERNQCERLVELSTSRVSESPSSTIESEYIGAFFGGISGTMEQLSLALAEIVVIGGTLAPRPRPRAPALPALSPRRPVCAPLPRAPMRTSPPHPTHSFLGSALCGPLQLSAAARAAHMHGRHLRRHDRGDPGTPRLCKHLPLREGRDARRETSSAPLTPLAPPIALPPLLPPSLSPAPAVTPVAPLPLPSHPRPLLLQVGGVTSSALDVLHQVTTHLNITEVTTAVETAAGGVSAQVTDHADLFASVAEGDLENYTMAAWLCLSVTVAVVLVLLLIASKLKNALAICAMATKPIAAMPGLLLLPTVSVLLSAVVVINFFFTVCMFLTPDPETTSEWLLLFTSNVTNALLSSAGHGVESLARGNADVDHFGSAIETLEVQLDQLPVDAHTLVYAAAGFEAFSGLWLLFLIEAVTYTTISGAVGYWYFTGSQADRDLADPADRTRFPVLCSLYRVLRFHLGTMAAGSFILAAFTAVRVVLAYIDAKTKDMQDANSVLKYALKCAQCLLWAFHRIVKFLTKFAFVTVATDGTPFCSAAFASFRLTTDHPLQMLANEAAMAVLSLLQLILTPLMCAILAYNAVVWQWRSSVLSAWDAANAWGDATCAQYQSDAIDACGYKTSVLGYISVTSLSDWPADEKPNELRVAVATLLVSFWVTRTFRDVYAAAVDTIFVCCVRSEDQDVAKAYRKPEMAETVLHGSSKNLISGGLIST